MVTIMSIETRLRLLRSDRVEFIYVPMDRFCLLDKTTFGNEMLERGGHDMAGRYWR